MDDRKAVVTLVAAGTAAVAATVRSEDEAGKEDHRDDEHHPGDDADPRGGSGHLGAAGLISGNRRNRLCGWGCGDRAGRWFGRGRRWFSHSPHLAINSEVPDMSQL
jgi:hypothetical protein